MTNTKFERDKVYKTRDGREARVICVDAPGEMSLITLVDTHAEWKLCRVYSNGRFSKYAGGMRHSQDHDLDRKSVV